jgi:hypothetical protein
LRISDISRESSKKAFNPHGIYVAYVRTSRSLSAMDSDMTILQVRSKWHFGRTCIFQFSGDNTRVMVQWLSPRRLQITCGD